MRNIFACKPKVPDEVMATALATKLVLDYFQMWGQTAYDRKQAMAEAAYFAHVAVKFREGPEYGRISWVAYCQTESQLPRWELFRQALECCFPLGKFENEVDAIKAVLLEFRNKSK